MKKTFIKHVYVFEHPTGESHLFTVYKKSDGDPYAIYLDGYMWATSDSLREVDDEIDDTVQWFGWSTVNPCFA